MKICLSSDFSDQVPEPNEQNEPNERNEPNVPISLLFLLVVSMCFFQALCAVKCGATRRGILPQAFQKSVATPFGWNDWAACHLSFSEAKAAYPRSRGISVLLYIDGAWYDNESSTFGCSDKVRWLSVAEPFTWGCWFLIVFCFQSEFSYTYIYICLFSFCGCFLSDTRVT